MPETASLRTNQNLQKVKFTHLGGMIEALAALPRNMALL